MSTHSVSSPDLSHSADQVRRELRKIKVKKAAGLDGISSRLLKSCADQLCGIVEHVFNLSLKLGRVPQLWKTSCVVPVPKMPHPKDLNSGADIALTSCSPLDSVQVVGERRMITKLSSMMDNISHPMQDTKQH